MFLVEAHQKCIGFSGISFNIMVNWNGKKKTKKTYTFWNIIKLSHNGVRAGSRGDPSHMSQVWHGCLSDNTFWRWSSDLVLRVGSSQKLGSTLNPNPLNIFSWNNKDPTLMIVTNILVYSRGSKVETLPPCWDLLTWVGLKDLGLHVNWPFVRPQNWPIQCMMYLRCIMYDKCRFIKKTKVCSDQSYWHVMSKGHEWAFLSI